MGMRSMVRRQDYICTDQSVMNPGRQEVYVHDDCEGKDVRKSEESPRTERVETKRGTARQTMGVSHNDTRVLLELAPDGVLVGVALAHLPDEIFEHVGDVPVALRGCLVEGEFPGLCKLVDGSTGDLALVALWRFG